MRKKHLDNEKMWSSLENQSQLEAKEHRKMMKGLDQHMKTLNDTGSLNVPEFTGSHVIIFN